MDAMAQPLKRPVGAGILVAAEWFDGSTKILHLESSPWVGYLLGGALHLASFLLESGGGGEGLGAAGRCGIQDKGSSPILLFLALVSLNVLHRLPMPTWWLLQSSASRDSSWRQEPAFQAQRGQGGQGQVPAQLRVLSWCPWGWGTWPHVS